MNSIKELLQLEYNYLSSPEELIKLGNLYLEIELDYTLRENIKIINDINQISFKNHNEQ